MSSFKVSQPLLADLKRILERKLVIRYALHLAGKHNGEMLIAEILSGSGFGGSPLDHLLHLKTTIDFDSWSKPIHFSLEFQPDKDKTEATLGKIVCGWLTNIATTNDATNEWWGGWIAKDEFIGVLVREEDIVWKNASPQSEHFAFYHGLLAQTIAADNFWRKHWPQRDQDMVAKNDAFFVLNRRFSTFTAQVRQGVMATNPIDFQEPDL